VNILLGANAKISPEVCKYPAIHGAAASGSLPVFRALCAAGADPGARDINGETALLPACLKGHYGMLKALFEAGVTTREGESSQYSLAVAAITSGRADVLQLVVDAGCRLNDPDPNELQPLNAAIVTGTAFVRILLSAGADPNWRDHEGRTSIACAHHYNAGSQVIQMIIAAQDEDR
jgi:ankyrin repeat protein